MKYTQELNSATRQNVIQAFARHTLSLPALEFRECITINNQKERSSRSMKRSEWTIQ